MGGSVVDKAFQRLFQPSTSTAAPRTNEHRRVLTEQLEAVDLIGARARLNALISGSGGTDSKLFPMVERTMDNLRELSRLGSPIENRRGHELFSSLTSAAVEAVLQEVSIPSAMLPILMSDGAIEAYFSMSSALQSYLFDYLFLSYAHVVEEARRKLAISPNGENLYDDIIDAITYCRATGSYKPSDNFDKRVQRAQKDPGFVKAWLKLAELRTELGVNYRKALERFWSFQGDFSEFLETIYETYGGGNADMLGMWRYAFSEVEDLLRDADDVLTSLDVTFALLARYSHRWDLENATEVLASYGISHVHSAIILAVNINNVRANARNTIITGGSMPDLEIPFYLRVDFFRSVNKLILNALSNSDLRRSDRRVHITAETDGGFLKIKVFDNGPGVKDISSKIAETEKGGLARINRIAKRRGWSFSVKNRLLRGFKATLLIDTRKWADQPASTTGGKNTVQPPDSFGGIVGADPERSMPCDYDGMDSDGLSDDYAVAASPIAAHQLRAASVMMPTILAGPV